MAKRRRFTPKFKAEVVLETLDGETSKVSELCRHHNLSADQLSKWKRQLLKAYLARKEEEIHLNDSDDIIKARDRIGHFITQAYHQIAFYSAVSSSAVRVGYAECVLRVGI